MKKAFVAVVAMAMGMLAATAASAQQKVLNVYNWSDYIDESVLDQFTQETGIKVRYDVFDSNEVLETKLLAGKTGYDIVVPSGSFMQRQIKAGLFQKLDKSKIPNLENQWPFVTEKLSVYDPGNEHAVNYMWGTTGIGYNVVKAKERLGEAPLNTWDIVFKPEILAKFKDCGIMANDAPEELIPSALNYLGLNPDSKNPADIEKAGELLMTIRPYIRKFHSSEYINALANGDICLMIGGWSGDVLQARDRAQEAFEKQKGAKKKPPVEVAYAVPKEGALMWFDNLAIPRDAKHVDEAHQFINFLLRPDIAAKNSNKVKYANGNLASQKLIDPEVLNNPAVYPDEATLQRLFTVTTYDPQVQRVVTRVWNKFKRGR